MPSDRCRREGQVGDRAAVPGRPQHLALPPGQRALPRGQRLRGQARVHHAQTGVDPADRIGQLPGRGVLDDEPARPRLHRPPQVPRPAERRHHQHLAGRQRRAQGGRGGDPVQPGHLDVQQRDVGPGPAGLLDHLVAAADLGHDLEVAFEVEQGRQRAPHQRLVVGEQQPDRLAHRVPAASRRQPEAAAALAAADAHRRAGGARPLAQPGEAVARGRVDSASSVRQSATPRPSSIDLDVVAAHPHRAARGAAVPYHVGHALADGPAEQLTPLPRHLVDRAGQVRRDPGRSQRRPRVGQLAGQRDLAETTDRRPDVGQRLARKPFQVSDFRARPGRVDLDQPAGQLGLDRDHRERVAEDVVHVAGHPLALRRHRELGHLVARDHQLGVAVEGQPHAEDGERRRA